MLYYAPCLEGTGGTVSALGLGWTGAGAGAMTGEMQIARVDTGPLRMPISSIPSSWIQIIKVNVDSGWD